MFNNLKLLSLVILYKTRELCYLAKNNAVSLNNDNILIYYQNLYKV